MKYLFSVLIMLLSIEIKAQKTSLSFSSGEWKQVFSKAKESNKDVFLYFWSPSCGPCIEMSRDIFTDSLVKCYYNDRFINYKVNMDSKEGVILAKRYNINSLPAYLYFGRGGKLLHMTSGGKGVMEFIQDAKNAFDPDKAFFTLKSRYDAGLRTASLLYAFSNAAGIIQQPDLYNKVVADYMRSQSNVQLTSSKNIDYIFNADTDFNSPATQYFLRNKHVFENRFGKAAVNRKTRFIISKTAEGFGRRNDLTALKSFQKAIAGIMHDEAGQLTALAQIQYLLGQPERDWQAFANNVYSYGQQYAARDSYTLYEASLYINAFVLDKKIIVKADRIIQQAIAVDASYLHLLTRAKLLHKLGDDPQARRLATEAVAVATKNGEKAIDAVELLAKMQK